MRITSFAIIAVLLPAAAFAQQGSSSRNFQTPPDAGKTLAPKTTSRSNPCASFGPGFVRVEGSDTCVKLGGAVSVGAGVSGGR